MFSYMILFNKYKILTPINYGSYGTIYKGTNIRTGELVAIKVEDKTETSLLPNEAKLYMYLAGSEGIPELKWFGIEDNKNILVMNLLDEPLTKIKSSAIQLDLITVSKIGIQMIQRLQLIHEKGLIHRDVKPDNWLFKTDLLYLIDFGFCKRYKLPDGSHIPLKQTSNIIGTLNYISLNVHYRLEPSRRDDLESVVYILIYLLDGLPWDKMSDHSLIVESKTNLGSNLMIPTLLKEMLIYVRQLRFDECPDYNWFIGVLTNNISC